MAKQKNQYYIGRQGNLLYYQWRDVYCIRTKGTLDRKRFYEDRAFEGSRKRAVEFGQASKLAAEVYHLLPLDLKTRGFIGKLTGWAHKKLMNGKSREVVKIELLKECRVSVVDKGQKMISPNCSNSLSQNIITHVIGQQLPISTMYIDTAEQLLLNMGRAGRPMLTVKDQTINISVKQKRFD